MKDPKKARELLTVASEQTEGVHEMSTEQHVRSMLHARMSQIRALLKEALDQLGPDQAEQPPTFDAPRPRPVELPEPPKTVERNKKP